MAEPNLRGLDSASQGTSSSSRLALAFSQASLVIFSQQPHSRRRESRNAYLELTLTPENIGRSFNSRLSIFKRKIEIMFLL